MIPSKRTAVAENSDGSLTVTLSVSSQAKAEFLRAWPDPARAMNLVIAPLFDAESAAESNGESRVAVQQLAEVPAPAPAGSKPPTRTISGVGGLRGEEPSVGQARGSDPSANTVNALVRDLRFQQWAGERAGVTDPFAAPMLVARKYIERQCRTEDGAISEAHLSELVRSFRGEAMAYESNGNDIVVKIDGDEA